MLKLVDVSQYNEIYDHQALKNATYGVLIKSSQGINIDPKFYYNITGQQAVGNRVGMWHFYHPDMAPQQQIFNFLNIYDGLARKPKWIGLDCEESSWVDAEGNRHYIIPPSVTAYSAWLMQWLEAVEKETGVIPTIYTRATWWNNWVNRSTKWKHYPLWVANYNTTSPTLPLDWNFWYDWQWGKSLTAGVRTPVDSDWFYGNEEQLDTHFGIVTPPPPPPPVEPTKSQLLLAAAAVAAKLAKEIETDAP